MEKIGKKTGIILKTQDYKENASLLTILTSTGLVTLILRGAKKTSSKNHLLNNIFPGDLFRISFLHRSRHF